MLQQLLLSPDLQHRVRDSAIAQAVAKVPDGIGHDRAVAAISQQITGVFGQVMDATRHALAVGIHDGFLAGLIVCGVVVVATLFLKDVPLQRREVSAVATSGQARATPDDAQLAVPHGI